MSYALPIGAPAVARRPGTSTLELAFLVGGGVVFATQVLQVFFRSDMDFGGANASPAAARVFAAFYAGLLVLSVGRRRGLTGTALAAPLFLVLLAFPLASLYWSVNRGATLSPAIAVFGTGLLGFYLAMRFDMRQLIVVLGLIYGLAGLGSTVLALAVPSKGVMDGVWAGAWSGLYVHKNSLGAGAAIGAVVLIYAIGLTRGPLRVFFMAALAATLLALVKAHSATALVNMALLVCVMLWARLAQKSPGRTIPLTLAGFGLLALLVLEVLVVDGLDPFFQLVGRSADISGRLPLWEITLQYVGARPLLGYGYEAFWIPFSSQVEFVASVVHYRPFYSHNGITETLLNGGVVLVALVVTAYVVSTARALRLLLSGERRFYATFPLVFMAFFLVANLTESRILFRNDLIWTLFVTVGVMLAVRSRAARAPAP
ncbi:O-antigen ligase family protein [Alsobacter sp. SYSU M60028]|uniref:O-antigen ligase family protein n=1 Tax=Alsobacter ponti TaxID=2962936 RepID=A0ABT1LE49_9HYPH|nr:O-antigen ligase family protein [Alsobacter ponti]MCP8939775.1 O-antigen ligase family protein [Alsobacter ponti]